MHIPHLVGVQPAHITADVHVSVGCLDILEKGLVGENIDGRSGIQKDP